MRSDERWIDELRYFLTQNIGRIIAAAELSSMCDGNRWLFDIQKLIDHEGLEITVFKTEPIGEPQYILLQTADPVICFSDDVPPLIRELFIDGKKLHCKMCGRQNGEIDPTTSGRRLRLFVKRLMPPKDWTGSDEQNLESICIACFEGLSTKEHDPPSARKIKIQVRRANPRDQLEVLKWLVSKFPKQAKSLLGC